MGQIARRAEAVVLPLAALLVGFAVFSIFLLVQGKSPVEFFALTYQAGFGTAFSWQNTLSRTAPLLFAALCVALPARLGLVVIGGEGAIVLGGVAAGAAGVALSQSLRLDCLAADGGLRHGHRRSLDRRCGGLTVLSRCQ